MDDQSNVVESSEGDKFTKKINKWKLNVVMYEDKKLFLAQF